MKGGNWSGVKTLHNADMYEIHPDSDLAKSLGQMGMEVPRHVTNNEMTDLLKQSNTGLYSWKKANGGSIHMAAGGKTPDLDTMRLALNQQRMYSPLEKAAMSVPRTKGKIGRAHV